MRTWKNQPHPSHEMSKDYCEIRSPVGIPRFYDVRYCLKCGHEQGEQPAGYFIDAALKKRCKGHVA